MIVTHCYTVLCCFFSFILQAEQCMTKTVFVLAVCLLSCPVFKGYLQLTLYLSSWRVVDPLGFWYVLLSVVCGCLFFAGCAQCSLSLILTCNMLYWIEVFKSSLLPICKLSASKPLKVCAGDRHWQCLLIWIHTFPLWCSVALQLKRWHFSFSACTFLVCVQI